MAYPVAPKGGPLEYDVHDTDLFRLAHWCDPRSQCRRINASGVGSCGHMVCPDIGSTRHLEPVTDVDCRIPCAGDEVAGSCVPL